MPTKLFINNSNNNNLLNIVFFPKLKYLWTIICKRSNIIISNNLVKCPLFTCNNLQIFWWHRIFMAAISSLILGRSSPSWRLSMILMATFCCDNRWVASLTCILIFYSILSRYLLKLLEKSDFIIFEAKLFLNF